MVRDELTRLAVESLTDGNEGAKPDGFGLVVLQDREIYHADSRLATDLSQCHGFLREQFV